MKIAIVDSNLDQVATISDVLDDLGHDCYSFKSSTEMLKRFAASPCHLIIINLQSREEKSSPVKAIRKAVPGVIPILCLTGSTNEYELQGCLDDGANDYLFISIRRRELAARVMVLLRRAYPTHVAESDIQFGSHVFEPGRGHVVINGELVELSRKEFDLALLFFRSAGRPLSRTLIMETVWKYETPEEGSRTMDTHVSRVRTKLGLTPEQGFRLSPVYGYGYRMDYVNAEGPNHQVGEKRTYVPGETAARTGSAPANRSNAGHAATS